MLSQRDVRRVIAQKTFREKFGECALRIGYITPFEHRALVGRQLRLQRRFGEFFIENGAFAQRDLAHLVKKQSMHNLQSVIIK